MRLFTSSPHDRDIVKLALPALGALAADPLVSLVDTAFVGRLGGTSLASLAVAAAVFGVAFGLFNFLAYGTTPIVARAIARGERDEAGRVAVAAAGIGVALGVVSAVVLAAAADPVLSLMGATAETAPQARSYLVIRALALPAVMIVTVGHGVFRGLQDTRTPFVVTAALNAVNLVLDPLLIFGLDWGIQGAAWATVVAQWLGAFGFVALLGGGRSALDVRGAVPRGSDLRLVVGAGRALVLRTGALLAVLTLATAVAARVGTDEVAAHQVVFQVWFFLSLVLDALAIAGQALIGKLLAVDRRSAAGVSVRLLWLGAVFGVAVSLMLLAARPWLPSWFTSDPDVVAAIESIYPFLVVMQPINALVFVWDGVIIGATDFGYLARTMAAASSAAAVILLAVGPMAWGLAGVWWSVAALMLGRLAAAAWWQARGPLASAPGRSRGSRAA
jgi:putative MATE family efflux protein